MTGVFDNNVSNFTLIRTVYGGRAYNQFPLKVRQECIGSEFTFE